MVMLSNILFPEVAKAFEIKDALRASREDSKNGRTRNHKKGYGRCTDKIACMKVIWTRKADASFNGVVNYLLDVWSVEIATKFVDVVDQTIELIVHNPELFKVTQYVTISREAFTAKHTAMFYRILDSSIEIEYFWGNFDGPKRINELLKFK